MRIEQYFLMTDYSLWEVIINGDSPSPTVVVNGVVQPVTIMFADQKLARRNEIKARGTLLMALPDKHQLKFNSHKDAKTLMEAIEQRFEGNTKLRKSKNSFKTTIDVDDLKEMDLRWQMAMLTMRARRECRSPKDTRRTGAAETHRRTAPVENSTSNALVSQCDASQTNDKQGLGYFSLESDFECLSPSCPSDRLQPSGGYNVVPPPIERNFMPPKPDLVFHTTPIAVETDHSDFTVQLSPVKPSQDLSHTTRPMAPIIEDWVSDSEDESEPNDPQIPAVVLTKSKPVSVTAIRPVSAAAPKIIVTRPRHAHSLNTKSKSPIGQYITRRKSPKTSNSPPKVIAAKALVVIIAKGKKRKSGNPQYALKDKGVIDSRCLRHMTGNMSYLFDFQELNGGYVAFGGNPKGGKISGKRKIKIGKLDFKDVYFVKELNFNLFSVSQMCDKKNKVLFTDFECLVLSPNFKLSDESQVLLRVPKENNMTPQQNSIAERKNRTLIEAARTMLADLLLPIPFWAEAVNTACYVQNRVLMTKPHNKTPYELLHGRTPSIGFMRPFGCPVTILNTLDPLGKFERKVDEGFLVGYSINSKAFRVFNSRTRIVQKTLHVNFLSSNPQNKEGDDAFDGKEHDAEKPESAVDLSPSSSALSGEQDNMTKKKDKGKSLVEYFTRNKDLNADFEDYFDNSKIEDIAYSDHENVGAEADFNNLETSITKVWILVDLPHGKRAISTKWVYRNKKDERDILVRNKARLVAQGHTQEEGTNYEEVFAPLARIEAIRLFLAYASFMGFMVYQMDVKSAFLYGTIEEEVYVCQPPRFEDPDHPDKVYKVVKALSGLHQASRAWYETLANYLLENGFYKGQIDQTLFIKKQKRDILLVHIYVDDIIFGATNKDLCKSFEKLMKDKFQMSSMGELTFFLGLQVKQKKDGIFISQDKYVAKILKKFGLIEGKSASTPIDTEKPLLKDPDGQMATGKEISNPFMAGSLPKPTLSTFIHKVMVTEATIRDALRLDDTEGVDYLPNEEIFTELARMGYEKPSTKLTFYKAFFSHHWKFLIHTILQLMSAKRTSWNEFSSAMASAVICLSTGRKFNFSKYIFDSLVRNVDSNSKFYVYPRFIHLIIQNQLGDLSTHSTKYISPALTQKVFANMRRVRKGCSRVETPLFEGMLVAREPEEQGDAEEQGTDDNAAEEPVTAVSKDDEALDGCATLARRVKHLEHDKVAQNLEITKLKTRVKKLERANKVKALKLRRLRKIMTSQRVDTSDDTIIEDVSNQGRMIDELDRDEGAVLMSEKEEKKAEEVKDITGDAQVEGRQADIYQIDMDHAAKVLSMLEDEQKVREAMEVVTTTKLITEVVAAVSETVSAAAVVPAATETASPVKVVVPSTRRRREVVIRDPEEESSIKTPTETKPKDKGKGIMVEEPKPMKKKQQVKLDEAYARKLHEDLNQDIDWEVAIDHVKQKAKENPYVLDYFKGMSYDDIRLIFEAKFNSNIEFLLNSKGQIEKEENRAIESINETPAQKAANRRRLNEEAKDVEELKQHLEIVPDEDDDVYTEATPIARKVTVVDYQIIQLNNKPHFKIIRANGTHQLYASFITLLKNFDREDLEPLWSIVKERFSTSKLNNFSNDFLLTTLRAMFGSQMDKIKYG
uniref:Uncharacterized protein n=1 Tax=Tanacetum cinerariifolium TaxID=118510 RepID=A0A6L2KC30_TANCI|nr:hypothetical protein [Tanacetum cinerariifolium]